MRKRIFFIPGRSCRQVGVFSGYGARSSPTLPSVTVVGVRYENMSRVAGSASLTLFENFSFFYVGRHEAFEFFVLWHSAYRKVPNNYSVLPEKRPREALRLLGRVNFVTTNTR